MRKGALRNIKGRSKDHFLVLPNYERHSERLPVTGPFVPSKWERQNKLEADALGSRLDALRLCGEFRL